MMDIICPGALPVGEYYPGPQDAQDHYQTPAHHVPNNFQTACQRDDRISHLQFILFFPGRLERLAISLLGRRRS